MTWTPQNNTTIWDLLTDGQKDQMWDCAGPLEWYDIICGKWRKADGDFAPAVVYRQDAPAPTGITMDPRLLELIPLEYKWIATDGIKRAFASAEKPFLVGSVNHDYWSCYHEHVLI